jgi:putative FmdB family regulatory protein
MPAYDYQCQMCEQPFEARHGFNDPVPACPHCGAAAVQRLILKAPRIAKGMLAATSKNASKEELQSKWAEETPKLRKQMADKLGEETVNRLAPTLNTSYE